MTNTKDDICEISAGDFFTQKLRVGNCTAHSWEYCKALCTGKKVLHIGCSDHPFNNPSGTLHIYLSKFAKELHGCDINGIEEIRKYFNGMYFDSISDVKEEYDVVIIPNVIEHLENPGEFLQQLFNISFNEVFVIVPNYEIQNQSIYDNGIFVERVHPDHYAWYSPYTLWNLFRKYTINREVEMNFFDDRKMISILIK